MLAPSKAIPVGREPTGYVPRSAPSLARSFITLSLSSLPTHMLAPSNAKAIGLLPTAKALVVVFASYQRNIAICCVFAFGGAVVAEIVSVLPEGLIVTLSPAASVTVSATPLIFLTTVPAVNLFPSSEAIHEGNKLTAGTVVRN